MNMRNWLLIGMIMTALTAGALAQETAPADGGDDVPALVPADTPEEGAGGEAGEADADANGQDDSGAVAPNKTPPTFLEQWGMPLALGAGIVLLFWMSSRSRKKQENQRREMLSSLKKGDKVTSIGGIVGTVLDVRDDEITVKVDEGNNVKMKFARWAIRGVGEEGKKEGPEKK
jgi:preprotein translocase subunit YajC